MADSAPSSHYWSPVTGDASAREAIKLAGLPVLVMAFDSVFVAVTLLFDANASPTLMFTFLALAVALVVIAFRMRKGHAGYMPFLAALFPAYLVLVVLGSFSGPPEAGGLLTQIFLVISKWIVPVLAAVLAFRGLRGWMWMRAHGMPVTY